MRRRQSAARSGSNAVWLEGERRTGADLNPYLLSRRPASRRALPAIDERLATSVTGYTGNAYHG